MQRRVTSRVKSASGADCSLESINLIDLLPGEGPFSAFAGFTAEVAMGGGR